MKQYLYDHARMTAARVENYMEKWADFPIVSLRHQLDPGFPTAKKIVLPPDWTERLNKKT